MTNLYSGLEVKNKIKNRRTHFILQERQRMFLVSEFMLKYVLMISIFTFSQSLVILRGDAASHSPQKPELRVTSTFAAFQ